MTDRLYFQQDGTDITEGIECECTFRSAAAAMGSVGLEIYDVLHNGKKIAEIYAGTPRNLVAGYGYRIERD